MTLAVLTLMGAALAVALIDDDDDRRPAVDDIPFLHIEDGEVVK